jgi:hypothetical protein
LNYDVIFKFLERKDREILFLKGEKIAAMVTRTTLEEATPKPTIGL